MAVTPKTSDFTTVDEYIDRFPAHTQDVLRDIRAVIHRVRPDAGEKISYKLPTVTVDGAAVLYFSGWKQHVSLYPVPRFDEALEADVAPFRSSKDTVKFPLKQPVPLDLVERIVTEMISSRGR